jgi:lipopolysaccharide transport system permease protein
MHQALRNTGPVPIEARAWELVWELAKREIASRYRGASFGALWSLIQPFMMLGVYTVAFGQILGARWPGVETTGSFAIILFVGLIVHGFLAECLAKAPTLVVGNANYVKRIVFPLEVLPWPVLVSAAFHFFTNAAVLAITLVALGRIPGPTALLLPIVLAPLAAVALGSMWMLAACAVYFRDINQLVAPLTTALFFLSTAIIPMAVVPDRFRIVFQLNPISLIADESRAVLLYGNLPQWDALLIYSAFAAVWFYLGFLLFSRLRRGFANVL